MEKKKLKIGDKLYRIDYEKTKYTYTVIGFRNVRNNPYVRNGLWYTLEPDGYAHDISGNTIFADAIDGGGKLYSSPELATIAYKRAMAKDNQNKQLLHIIT